MVVSLAQVMGEEAVLSADQAILRVSGITADSRKVKPGYLFAALPGEKADGAKYIDQAFAKGAVAALAAQGTKSPQGPVIEVANPRLSFAKAAAHFYQIQPDLIVAVTGTNGKTSVAAFTRQIWLGLGMPAASIGTIGVVGPTQSTYLSHTTPDPAELHEILAELKQAHVDHVALEASSHGLAQYRLDGIRFSAAAFTNLTQDHLDYHGDFENYFLAKARLFTEILAPEAAAVINVDSAYGERLASLAAARGLRVFSVGHQGRDLQLLASEREGFGQLLRLKTATKDYHVPLPLVGDFQASNALVAAGLVLAMGGEEALVMHQLASLQGAKGRLELVGRTSQGAPVFVDYAHTPDALENALAALKPYTRGRLIVAFGCGGDRDKGKRPLMAQACVKGADVIIVTDDNPRTEDPAQIRAEALAAAPGALEIADRAQAIAHGISLLKQGDVFLVAGKGHEEGQTIGTVTHPFSDQAVVLEFLAQEKANG